MSRWQAGRNALAGAVTAARSWVPCRLICSATFFMSM